MNYLTAMGNMLSFSPFPVTTTRGLKQLQLYAIANVLVLGLIYGISAALFSNVILAEKGFHPDAVNLAKVIIAGIPVAFFMHAGAALFIWVFLKAMGGKSDFMTAYFHIGAAAISLWPMAPFIALMQIGAVSNFLIFMTGLFSVYGFAVIIRVIKQAFGLSAVRMTLATTVTLMYISCFLYLWV